MSKRIIKEYILSNEVLIHTLDIKLNFAARDEAEFITYGFSPADRLTLRADCDAFAHFPDDIEFESDYIEAVEERRAIRKELETATKQIMRRVVNRYGRYTARYRAYGSKGMGRKTNIQFEWMGRRVERNLRRNLSELASEGVTLAMVDAYLVLLNRFITADDTAVDRKGDRIVATENRLIMGNALYRRFTKLCAIGKTIWEDSSEAKYNDYLWYKKVKK